jgi:hypothetical protein
MNSQTMVFGAEVRRSEKWRVYQIRTANSTYELEVQGATPGDSRRCCVLTCVAPASRAGHRFEDSAPRAGDESLFAVSPLDWIGRCLVVGSARTSEVQSVEFVGTSEGSAARRGAGSNQTLVFNAPEGASAKPKAEEPPTWAPFPLGSVQMAETAATLLRLVEQRADLRARLRDEPLLRRRLENALESCRLVLSSLEKGA